MTTNANPYASPRANDAEHDQRTPDAVELGPTAWRIILAGEKLRRVYLVLLSIVTLATLGGTWDRVVQFGMAGMLATITGGFIGANVCFTAGHVLELIVAALGVPERPRTWLRGVVFVLGTIFASLLAVLAVVAGPPLL
ncbi:MAG: hypothetical protein AAF790_02705 [Planctomycetota bacterium]